MNLLIKICGYLGCFVIGGYVYAHNHGAPVEEYRWIMTITFTLGFIIYSNVKDKKQ
jgi:hypothetical protein